MLKKLAKSLWDKLNKIEWIRREVKRYKIEKRLQAIDQQKQRNHDDWTELMRSGGTVRVEDKDRMMAEIGDSVVRPFGMKWWSE